MPLLPYLKEKPEIKIAYEKKDNLLEDEKMHELLTVARYVYGLANERKPSVSALEVLSYPFFDLPVTDVIKLLGQARADKRAIFDLMAESDNDKIKAVADFFAGLVAKSFNEPLEIFLDYLIGAVDLNGFRSPFMEYYASQDDYSAFTLYESLASLRGKLQKHFGDKKLRLGDLVEMIDDYEAAGMPINLSSPYKEADEAVSVLSAHKAKGLEFEYVFIIDADHMAWGKGKGNNNLLALPSNVAQIRHTGTTDGEKLRILYVALTRAKQGLYITNSLHDFNNKNPERLEYLDEVAVDDKVISPLIPSGEANLHYDMYIEQVSESNLKSWLKPYVTATPDLTAIYRERVAKWRMSASGLTSFIDIVYAGPEAFFRNYILQAPREPATEAMIFGDLVHAVFERVTNRGISNEAAIEFFADELAKKDLNVDVMQKLREKGAQDLTVSLSAFGEILRNGKAEVDLAPEKLTVEGVPVTGKIDHIAIDENAKTIEIYDFKTGGYHKEKWQSHATLYKYMLQLGFYKLLLNASPTYRKYKVEKAHILFVTPDKDGEVYDKVYTFNNEEEKELVKLIQAVYDVVVSLDFLKRPDIFVPADNTLGIKDIKQFVKLLTN